MGVAAAVLLAFTVLLSPPALAQSGVCGRTAQVRAALLGGVQANDDAITDCSQVTTAHLQALNGTLNLNGQGIAGLKSGDFANLTNLANLFLDNNDLQTLPDGVFGGLSPACSSCTWPTTPVRPPSCRPRMRARIRGLCRARQ